MAATAAKLTLTVISTGVGIAGAWYTARKTSQLRDRLEKIEKKDDPDGASCKVLDEKVSAAYNEHSRKCLVQAKKALLEVGLSEKDIDELKLTPHEMLIASNIVPHAADLDWSDIGGHGLRINSQIRTQNAFLCRAAERRSAQ